MIYKIKITAALILIIMSVLPLSKCSYDISSRKDPQVSQQQVKKQKQGQQDEHIKYFYARDFVDPSWLGFFVLLAFTWPLPVLLYYKFGKHNKTKTALMILEPFFCLWSGYIVYSIVHFGSPTIPGYVALSAIVTYFLAATALAHVIIREWYQIQKR